MSIITALSILDFRKFELDFASSINLSFFTLLKYYKLEKYYSKLKSWKSTTYIFLLYHKFPYSFLFRWILVLSMKTSLIILRNYDVEHLMAILTLLLARFSRLIRTSFFQNNQLLLGRTKLSVLSVSLLSSQKSVYMLQRDLY